MTRKTLLRTLYLVHRWLGISLCLLMSSWCASGLVMLWHTWPRPDENGQQQAHSVLVWPDHVPVLPAAFYTTRFQSFRIGMIGQVPVLTLYAQGGQVTAVDLRTGQTGAVNDVESGINAGRYVQALGGHGAPQFDGLTTDDQWVLNTHGRAKGFARFRFQNAAHNVVYVSRFTGDVVQATTAQSRFWAWIGAIPHWLYPAVLRKHPFVWQQVVIVLSGAGVFLTVTGLWVGVLRVRGRWPFSPYRRWHFVHHVSGTVFGSLALVWITTGLLTMNPAGVFQSDSEKIEPVRITGTVLGQDLVPVLRQSIETAPPEWRSVHSVLVGGKVFLSVMKADGHWVRLDKALQPSSLRPTETERDLQEFGLMAPTQKLTFLTKADAYYFNKDTRTRHFPVLRGIARDDTYFYLNAETGEVEALIDSSAQRSRWFVYGLHDMDFWAWLRHPLARWGLVAPLLCGVLAIFLSAVMISVHRLRRHRQSSAVRRVKQG
ncbi:PepSY domain-containing protein [Acetobacter cibinongensis]|uniref:Peptidase n=1 Tax=Acetobacter cibinongensis TaxID=146475 RepID=A0A1Z5YYK0_9PROT|nr:PepSY domain-containing protein [Acetobacter cibinongensis]OUJ04470.1 hypothetical protein HK14_04065 [Acetobacter cibinongensis]